MAKHKRDPSVPPPLGGRREGPHRRKRENPGIPGIPGVSVKQIGQLLGLPDNPRPEDWLFGLGRMVQTMREAGEQRRARKTERADHDDELDGEDDEC